MKKEDILNTEIDYIIVKDSDGNIIDEIRYKDIEKNKSALTKLKEKLLKLKKDSNKGKTR